MHLRSGGDLVTLLYTAPAQATPQAYYVLPRTPWMLLHTTARLCRTVVTTSDKNAAAQGVAAAASRSDQSHLEEEEEGVQVTKHFLMEKRPTATHE